MRKPAAPRRLLILVAGLLWAGVGILLLGRAIAWWLDASRGDAAPAATLGLLAGGVAGRFGFASVARRNLDRLGTMGRRVCIFAFQAWRSWILVAVMIAMGVAIRASPLPRVLVAIVYAAVGGGLLLASLLTYAPAALASHRQEKPEGQADQDESAEPLGPGAEPLPDGAAEA